MILFTHFITCSIIYLPINNKFTGLTQMTVLYLHSFFKHDGLLSLLPSLIQDMKFKNFPKSVKLHNRQYNEFPYFENDRIDYINQFSLTNPAIKITMLFP